MYAGVCRLQHRLVRAGVGEWGVLDLGLGDDVEAHGLPRGARWRPWRHCTVLGRARCAHWHTDSDGELVPDQGTQAATPILIQMNVFTICVAEPPEPSCHQCLARAACSNIALSDGAVHGTRLAPTEMGL